MELFCTVDEPKEYIGFKMDKSNTNHFLCFGIQNAMTELIVTGHVVAFLGQTTIISTKQGYHFYKASPLTKDSHVLEQPNGRQRVMMEADKDDPTWDLVNFMYEGCQKESVLPMYKTVTRMTKTPPIKEWSEVDDSILRGWKKENVLLCEVFPTRSLDEIKRRISFLQE